MEHLALEQGFGLALEEPIRDLDDDRLDVGSCEMKEQLFEDRFDRSTRQTVGRREPGIGEIEDDVGSCIAQKARITRRSGPRHLRVTDTPTGEMKPNPYKDPHNLKGSQLDDVFTGLVRDSSGKAEFSVQGKQQKLSVLYGPKYNVAVVYAPPGRDFNCFEPMTGITNSMNLAHEGKYKDLQSIPPGGVWKESFWIKPSGF